MEPEEKARVLAGRKAVEAYRTAHANLHSKPWTKSVPQKHTPLLNTLLAGLKELGFKSVEGFYEADGQLEDGGIGKWLR